MSNETKILVPTSPLYRLPTAPDDPVSRRNLLKAALGMGVVSLLAPMAYAQQKQLLTPTPDQILGPFYPVIKPTDGGTDLTKLPQRPDKASGKVIYVMGQVVNRKGEPVRRARIEIWQANAGGRYVHPSDRGQVPTDPYFDGYAVLRTDDEGRYRFKTIKPGAYAVSPDWKRPPHIHFEIKGGVNRLITQMYFSDEEALNNADKLLQSSWSKESLIAKVVPPTPNEEPDAQLVMWDVVLLTG
ncbi:MAG: hypothetical protein EXR36_05860 [Betaproteobacteria bacterium]|nr:hypothetical protein [Betaproteobacteria bacterium]